MPVINVRLPFKNGRIYQLGDTHDGTLACVRTKIDEVVDKIACDENSLWTMTGDAMETIMVDDPRYEADQHGKTSLTHQVNSVVKTFSPIANKCVSWNIGNHELTILHLDNVVFRILEKMNRIQAYGAWSSIVNFHNPDGEKTITGFWTHGPQKKSLKSDAGDAGQRQANTEAKLKKILSPLYGEAHYMGCGHYHTVVLRNPSRELYLASEDACLKQHYTSQPLSGYIHPDLRYYGCNGGFLKKHMMGADYPNTDIDNLEPITYSEKAGYGPVEMGIIQINIEDHRIASCEKVML